tara:strand:- start:144 stop:347 length:204 start_codon:yes stop_codon:yes gene_type:complete
LLDDGGRRDKSGFSPSYNPRAYVPDVSIGPPYIDDSDMLEAEDWDDLDSAVWLAQRGWDHSGTETER